MKILLLLAKGAELMEVSPFIDIFGWHSHYGKSEIKVISCGLRKEIVSTFNVTLKTDLLIDEVNADDYDALAIPGGFGDFGFYEDAYSDDFLNIIKKFHEQNKFIASICVGALPIGKAGILKGKNATTYHLGDKRRQKQLAEFGANIVDEPVVVEENIITSWCPSTAPEVAFKLLEFLTSRQDADNIRKIMGF